MYHSLVSLARWLQNTPMALAVGGSDWAYPFVQLTHFTGLSLWLGTSVAVDLRLIGLGKGGPPAESLSRALLVWNWIGFGIAVTGGFLLFSISAERYVLNPAFRTKLGVLIPLALASHIVVQQKARTWSEASAPPLAAKVVSAAELLLWVSVATAAVCIPYF